MTFSTVKWRCGHVSFEKIKPTFSYDTLICEHTSQPKDLPLCPPNHSPFLQSWLHFSQHYKITNDMKHQSSFQMLAIPSNRQTSPIIKASDCVYWFFNFSSSHMLVTSAQVCLSSSISLNSSSKPSPGSGWRKASIAFLASAGINFGDFNCSEKPVCGRVPASSAQQLPAQGHQLISSSLCGLHHNQHSQFHELQVAAFTSPFHTEMSTELLLGNLLCGLDSKCCKLFSTSAFNPSICSFASSIARVSS